MNLSMGLLRRRYAAPSLCLLVLAVAAPVSVPGDEQDSNPCGKEHAKERITTDPPVGKASPSEESAERAGALSKLLNEMSDRQLLLLAQGGELPAKLHGFEEPARVSEALLRELAKRWRGNVGPPATGTRVTEGSAAVASESGAHHPPNADSPSGVAEPRLTSTIVEAVSGTPYSVGFVELRFAAGHDPTFLAHPTEGCAGGFQGMAPVSNACWWRQIASVPRTVPGDPISSSGRFRRPRGRSTNLSEGTAGMNAGGKSNDLVVPTIRSR